VKYNVGYFFIRDEMTEFSYNFWMNTFHDFDFDFGYVMYYKKRVYIYVIISGNINTLRVGAETKRNDRNKIK